MVDKLDQSLDTIMTERKKANPRPRAGRNNGRRAPSGAQKAAPVGGVKKTERSAKQNQRAPAPAAGANGESKIQVSNLPHDVTELQIKDYFTQSVGPVKKVLLYYGPNGQSRGVAQISFTKVDAASRAVKELDGTKVDQRPMKVEVILGAKDAPAPAAPKSLNDRIGKPKPVNKDKAQPKPANADKAATEKKNGTRRGQGRTGRGGAKANPRAKPKTAEELDLEMADYFVESAPADGAVANGGAVQPAAIHGEVAMEDEIS